MKKPPDAKEIDRRVNANINLARFWARRMERFHGYNDALSLALEGLLTAAQKYEVRPSVKFGTYASYMIKARFAGEMRKRMTKSRGGDFSICSIDAPIGNNGFDGSTLRDIIPDGNAETPVRMVELLDRADQVRELLRMLPPFKRKILEMRYGLNGRAPMLLEEIGALYGLTRERIRQIEAESLRRFWRYLSHKPEQSAACSV